MNRCNAPDAGAFDAFDRAQPQLKVGVHRVLNQYRNINTFQRIRDFLYGKRVYCGARTYPEYIHPCFKASLNVRRIGDFGCDGKSRFLLGFGQPL